MSTSPVWNCAYSVSLIRHVFLDQRRQVRRAAVVARIRLEGDVRRRRVRMNGPVPIGAASEGCRVDVGDRAEDVLGDDAGLLPGHQIWREIALSWMRIVCASGVS